VESSLLAIGLHIRTLSVYLCQYKNDKNDHWPAPWPPIQTSSRSPVSDAGIWAVFANGGRLAPRPDWPPISRRSNQATCWIGHQNQEAGHRSL